MNFFHTTLLRMSKIRSKVKLGLSGNVCKKLGLIRGGIVNKTGSAYSKDVWKAVLVWGVVM